MSRKFINALVEKVNDIDMMLISTQYDSNLNEQRELTSKERVVLVHTTITYYKAIIYYKHLCT